MNRGKSQSKGEIELDEIQQEVDWTILIYANGNNELEPEMRQLLLDAEKIGSSSNVHVVIQIGRAEYRLVKLFRHDIKLKNKDQWSGVRRYFVNKGNSNLVGNLKKVNMADPKQLYHFIKWGMQTYPAKKYMLILGGHSYDGIGMMIDYSRKAPYLMGIPEMVKVINMATNELDKKVDILLLDTCSANSIELIYEFGKDENHAVQNIITYIISGPIEGLPYENMIHLVQANSKVEDITVIIKNIVDNLPYDLISFEVDYQKLQQIKQFFNDKSFEYLAKKTTSEQVYYEMSALEWEDFIDTISDYLTSIIIHYKKSLYNNQALITVSDSIPDRLKLMKRYYQLGFAQNNHWIDLFAHKPVDVSEINTGHRENLIPLKMSPQEVYIYISIMNPELGELEKNKILEQLYHDKKWPL